MPKPFISPQYCSWYTLFTWLLWHLAVLISLPSLQLFLLFYNLSGLGDLQSSSSLFFSLSLYTLLNHLNSNHSQISVSMQVPSLCAPNPHIQLYLEQLRSDVSHKLQTQHVQKGFHYFQAPRYIRCLSQRPESQLWLLLATSFIQLSNSVYSNS